MPKKPLTETQKKKLKRIADVLDKGNVAFLEYLFDIEEKMENDREKIEKRLPTLENIIEKVKGKDANPKEVANILKQDKSFVEQLTPADGSDYILTEQDKVDIAKSIPVPVVEKIIEKTEVIREQPVVTENRITEIKEVAVLDPDQLPTYGEQFRDGLEILEGDERLSIESIRDLREELDELKKERERGQRVVTGGIIGRDLIKNYDLSEYLDGSTKTFDLPGVWSVISVATSSAPNVLRPIIDYTNTQMTITFTDEINAETTLASGQTVVITYVSL